MRKIVCLLVGVVACGGPKESGTPSSSASSAPPPAASAAPTGVVDTVLMISDAQGNYFKPNTLSAHRGDVVRFILSLGVHNVDFLPDSNAGKSGLPAPSTPLQLPGQTYDVPVNFAPGSYYFQCDPHAALGMHGHLTVQ